MADSLTKIIITFRTFLNSQDGLASTEYLILLGLLVGASLVAILAISGGLNDAWASWATWFGDKNLETPE